MSSKRDYLIIIEKAGANYSAYAPDLPGCVATGRTRLQTEKNMRSAIQMHLDGLREDRMAIPRPSASATYVEMVPVQAMPDRTGRKSRRSPAKPA